MTEQIEWRNRIIESGVKPASQFMAHPSNWRKHPVRQRKALKGSLDSLGWVAPVLENKRTGYLIDGHERVWQALQNGDAPVPYIVVDLDESEEAQALLSLDAIAALAQTDAPKVDELLRMVDSSNEDVQEFLTNLSQDVGLTKFDPMDEWKGMPEFNNQDALGAVLTLKVHFAKSEDITEFSRIVGQTVTEKSTFIWFPKKADENLKQYRVIDES